MKDTLISLIASGAPALRVHIKHAPALYAEATAHQAHIPASEMDWDEPIRDLVFSRDGTPYLDNDERAPADSIPVFFRSGNHPDVAAQPRVDHIIYNITGGADGAHIRADVHTSSSHLTMLAQVMDRVLLGWQESLCN